MNPDLTRTHQRALVRAARDLADASAEMVANDKAASTNGVSEAKALAARNRVERLVAKVHAITKDLPA